MKCLPESVKSIVKPVIQSNGYFGHSENLLISMLCDNDARIKKEAVSNISMIRNREQEKLPRKFVMPTFNFDATSYTEIINWDTAEMFEPPLTKHISGDILQEIKLKRLEIPAYPCHSQSVERAVKLVSNVCLNNIGIIVINLKIIKIKLHFHRTSRTSWSYFKYSCFAGKKEPHQFKKI